MIIFPEPQLNGKVPDGGLLTRGKIYLVRTPVDGRWGIWKLYSMLSTNQFGFNWDAEVEVWCVFVNSARTRLRILHSDSSGIDLMIRVCYRGLFSVKLEQAMKSECISREQLRQLIYSTTS